MTHDEIVSTLRASLADAMLEHYANERDVWVRVHPASWRVTAQSCKDALGCDYFCFLSGMDWQPNPALDGEKTFDAAAAADAAGVANENASSQEVINDPQIRYAGGTSRFQVIARLYNTSQRAGVTLTADLNDIDPVVPSWVPVYRGADWHERETSEMFGFSFDGHPNPRHIYLPDEFEGYPLRKDFPLLARQVRPWPGIVDMEEMPKKEDDEEPEQDFA